MRLYLLSVVYKSVIRGRRKCMGFQQGERKVVRLFLVRQTCTQPSHAAAPHFAKRSPSDVPRALGTGRAAEGRPLVPRGSARRGLQRDAFSPPPLGKDRNVVKPAGGTRGTKALRSPAFAFIPLPAPRYPAARISVSSRLPNHTSGFPWRLGRL